MTEIEISEAARQEIKRLLPMPLEDVLREIPQPYRGRIAIEIAIALRARVLAEAEATAPAVRFEDVLFPDQAAAARACCGRCHSDRLARGE